MKNIPIIIVLVVIVLLLLNTCRLSRKVSSQATVITAEQLSKQKQDSLINEQKQTIYTQVSIISDNTLAINELTDTIFKLKKKDEKNTEALAYWQGRTSTEIKEVTVPYLDSAGMKRFSDSVEKSCQEVLIYMRDSTIKVPRVAGDSTPHYSILQTVNKNGVIINSLVIPDTLNLRFIERRGSLFRKSRIEVQYFHTNPLIKTTGSNSVFYKPKKKPFLTRVVLPIAIGVGAGILISQP